MTSNHLTAERARELAGNELRWEAMIAMGFELRTVAGFGWRNLSGQILEGDSGCGRDEVFALREAGFSSPEIQASDELLCGYALLWCIKNNVRMVSVTATDDEPPSVLLLACIRDVGSVSNEDDCLVTALLRLVLLVSIREKGRADE